jgi:hypothetical protein
MYEQGIHEGDPDWSDCGETYSDWSDSWKYN